MKERNLNRSFLYCFAFHALQENMLKWYIIIKVFFSTSSCNGMTELYIRFDDLFIFSYWPRLPAISCPGQVSVTDCNFSRYAKEILKKSDDFDTKFKKAHDEHHIWRSYFLTLELGKILSLIYYNYFNVSPKQSIANAYIKKKLDLG